MNAQSRCTGFCQRIEEGVFVGWAINVVKPEKPTIVSAFIDDVKVAEIKCDIENKTIQQKLNFFRSDIGFQFSIPERYRDNKNHKLSFQFIDETPFIISDSKQNNKQVSYVYFQLLRNNDSVEYESFIDGWKNGSIVGWVLKKDLKTGEYTGNCSILVVMNGIELQTVQANRYRPDVASAYNSEPRCGFAVVIPKVLRKHFKAEFRVYVMPDYIEVKNSPYQTSLVDDLLEQKLLIMNQHIDSLYNEINSLKSEIKNLIAYPEYVIDEYHLWAQKYFSNLPKLLDKKRQNLKDLKIKLKSPKISIICPVYKPDLSHFREAVDSVLCQTYKNWELILIDDGGKSASIQREIKKYVLFDNRIKAITLTCNRGISEATNEGLKQVKGQWIAFFDHDDLLVPEALEMMIMEAQCHNAYFVYSDEDKLDNNGEFTEPNLKPDFNYRYLLGCNYICHFVMIHVDYVRKVGFLSSQYNGAQDHDFILRLTEYLKSSQIHHVQEILYHWRITPNSTAETTANKQYAVKAGVDCVSDHLKRTGHEIVVSSIENATMYKVAWNKIPQSTVTIIIPFKDQIEITKQCVDRILDRTNYSHYNILLVDNGSKKTETLEFIKNYSRKKTVNFLTVQEEFNFSRLNNLAAQKIKSDFYLFLNNDVFIENEDWLEIMLNEAEFADDIAIVGAKLLYPNGRIQHGGIIVGPGEVAQHMNRGMIKNDFGYVGRSVLSQELTAVTAAMMLVKASVFHEVDGFDEINLKIAYNDVDLCLKVREAGYRIIMCMDVIAIHHESYSRGGDDRPEHQERFTYEMEFMEKKWGEQAVYKNDSAYSPHFKVKPQLFYELTDPAKI